MADSKSYGVREAGKLRLALRESSCVTIAIWRIATMLTMTGIGSLPEENEAK